MEKLIYGLWKPDAQDAEDFRNTLLGRIAPMMADRGAGRIKVNVADQAVAPARGLRMVTRHEAPDATVSFWLNAAHQREIFATILSQVSPRLAGYAVAESCALPNRAVVADMAGRTRGFNQVTFLEVPATLSHAAWLNHWMDTHTRVAIETQANFYYCQNIITRPLTADAPSWAGIVEECFPDTAMDDRAVFFDADGDPDKERAHFKQMMASCAAFIDFETITVVPMSEYRLGQWNDTL